MPELEAIDAELRLVFRAWRVAREMGDAPSVVHIDELPDRLIGCGDYNGRLCSAT